MKAGAAVLSIVAVTALLVAWWNTGSLDRVLYKVGLNRTDCLTTVFGGVTCGRDAERLCSQALFSEVDACQDITGGRPADETAEKTPEEQLEDDLAALEPEPATAGVTGRPGDTLHDEGIAFTLDRVQRRTDFDEDPLELVAYLDYRNDTTAPVDPICGAPAFQLVAAGDRVYSPRMETYELPENEEVCQGGLGPDMSEDAAVLFKVPADAEIVAFRAWNPEGDGPEDDGGHYFEFEVDELAPASLD